MGTCLESIVLASMVKGQGEVWAELKKELRRSPQLHAKMKAAKSHDAKEEVRREWYNLRAIETSEELELIQTYSTEDYTKGTWYTLLRIAWEMGGDVEAAKNYCQSCIELGKTEFKINVLSEL